MRLKQKMALLLTGVMLAGSVGILNPMEVKATAGPEPEPDDPTNTFTLTVPGDTSITKSGWNIIGDVKVGGDIDASKMVTVEISTEYGSKLISGSNEVSYTIKKAQGDTSATESIVFYATAVNNKEATSTIGADVEDYNGKAEGTYTDTIIFEATLKEITVDKAGGGKLSLDELGGPSDAFSVGKEDAKWYVAYNDFIPKTSYSSWQNAQDFVAALNAAEYDGHKDWQLLDSEEMATAWYAKFPAKRHGGVQWLRSSKEIDGWMVHSLDCNDGKWKKYGKSAANSGVGFVVLRETEAPQATGVEYTLTGTNSGGRVLESDVLLQITNKSEFTYKGTKYTAYNGFIGQTKGANFADAQNFIDELNKVVLDGREGGWTLLTDKEMAYKWWLSTNSEQNKGASSIDGVKYVWSSYSNEGSGYYWNCSNAEYVVRLDYGASTVKANAWKPIDESESESGLGFVVLRDDGKTPQTLEAYKLENGGTISVDDLGEPSSSQFKYDDYYEPYNDFIPYTAGASWNDAMGFVELLNDCEYDEHSDWMLLDEGDSCQMVYEWWQSTAEPDDTNDNGIKIGEGEFDDVTSVWLASDSGENGHYWNCGFAYGAAKDGEDSDDVICDSISQYVKSGGDYSNLGFVIIRPTAE